MRFLLYVNSLGRSSTNGTAITILARDLCNFLVKKNYDVIVVGNKDIVEEDIQVPYLSLRAKGLGDLEYSVNLAKIIKRFNPHVIHAFMKPMSINLALSTLIYKSEKTLYLGSFHNVDNYSKYKNPVFYPYRLLVKNILSRLDFVTGPSKAVLDDIRKTYFISDRKLRILPNYIDFSKIDEMSKEDVEVEGDYIINVGRLEYQKNHEHLIIAFYKIKDLFPDLRLLIVGDGSLKEKLVSLTKKLGVHDRVIFLGYKNNPWKYIKRAKAFIMTSYFEGLPLVLIESMYLKLPIVAYSIDSVRELTENVKYALLARPYDIDDLAKKIVLLLTNKEKQEELKEKGYYKTLTFSMENYLSVVFNLMEEKRNAT